MKLDDNELYSILKLNKVILDEKVESKICQVVRKKLNIRNVLALQQLTKLFKLSSLSGATSSYIERCYTMLATTDNFMELDFIHVLKILSSSRLSITSELEVFNAANTWVSHNLKERRKFAKNLLLTVRFPLFPDDTLKYLLGKSSSFIEIDECNNILQEISQSKKTFFQNKSDVYNTTRYCDQQLFDILICGGVQYVRKGSKAVRKVSQFNVNSSKGVKVFRSMIAERYNFDAVCVKGEAYVFGGVGRNNSITCVEKYSPSTKTWTNVAKMVDDRFSHCACTFMDNVFIISGLTTIDSCLQFNTEDYSWKQVARINERRERAACAVFEESIVVSGGYNNNFNSKTVESYDVIADTWSPMPSMIRYHSHHSLVVVKNKLFVIGSSIYGCEVFDNSF